jgi:hypothetical protein
MAGPGRLARDSVVAEAMTATLIKTETVRCGVILQDKGRMMQQIGNNIIRRSKEMDKLKTPASDAPAETKSNNPG